MGTALGAHNSASLGQRGWGEGPRQAVVFHSKKPTNSGRTYIPAQEAAQLTARGGFQGRWRGGVGPGEPGEGRGGLGGRRTPEARARKRAGPAGRPPSSRGARAAGAGPRAPGTAQARKRPAAGGGVCGALGKPAWGRAAGQVRGVCVCVETNLELGCLGLSPATAAASSAISGVSTYTLQENVQFIRSLSENFSQL